MCVRTRSVNVGFDDGDAKAVLLAVPFGEFGRCGGFSLPVQSDKQKGGSTWLEGRRWAKDSDQFGVEDVHGVGLHGEARAWFLFSHPRFQSINDFLGLPDVEIRFLKGTSEAACHLTKFFFVEFPLVFEQAKRAEDTPRQALKCHAWASWLTHFKPCPEKRDSLAAVSGNEE